SEVLEKGSPLKLMILEPAHVRLDSVSYTFTVSKSGEIFKLKDEKGEIQEYKLGQNINTPIGPITLVPQNNNTNWDNDLTITYQPVSTTIDELLELVKISPNKDKQSFVVNFSMEHADREKAALILNSLIEQYNADVTEDKALVTRATSNFINSRLDLISKDLAEADSKVADYKDRNQMVDMQTEAQLYMQNATDNERKLVEYQTQLSLADMMREASASEDYTLLPSNIGLSDPSIQANINSYNELILERDDLLKSATQDNPMVQQLNRNIGEVNRNLKTSLDNYRKVLQGNVNALRGQKERFEGR